MQRSAGGADMLGVILSVVVLIAIAYAIYHYIVRGPRD